MPTDHRERLARIRSFTQLVAYLRDELGWPIDSDDFEELTFEYTPAELGIDAKNAAKIQEIKRLRPLRPGQPWGIFFVKFEPKRLPVVALRRILGQVALKKRASANNPERQAWAADDLLFVSNYGEGEERRIAFAHFSKPRDGHDLPTLKVLGWDNLDTPLHLDAVARELTHNLTWPDDEGDDPNAWREHWRAAFTLRHREVITTSKELSERLAELARAIRDRIRTALAIETESGPLTKLMKAFRTALVHDLDEAGFADMYAQTIAYGLLSARITDPRRRTADDFAAHMRTNPFLRELMQTFLRVGGRRGKAGGPGIDFDELGVSEVVALLDHDRVNLEAVVRDFGDRNPQEDPVIHFYEHFLKAYDKKQKMSRGVFYTPRPVVSYIVRSVDELLRTEFGLTDGLADTATWGEMAKRHKDLKIPEGTSPGQDFVQILDPATGTGTFLVEVIDLIHNTMAAKWKSQDHGEKKILTLWNEYVPKHLLPRLHGYELLMAPYAIAHLKIGLKLLEAGYRFESNERARVYLTNALEPAGDEQLLLDFLPALAHEAQAVNEIKRNQRFTVVIGNPPYSKMSGNLSKHAVRLVEPFRSIAGKRIVAKAALAHELNLQDDYVKFYGLLFAKLRESGGGVGSYISNFGYLESLSLLGMRWNLLHESRKLFFINLGGRLADRTALNTDDENVFEIEQGVAIGTIICRGKATETAPVQYTRLFGSRKIKYQYLLSTTIRASALEKMRPTPPFFRFVPSDSEAEQEFHRWLALDEIFPRNSGGVITSRDNLTISLDPDELVALIRRFSQTPRGDSALQEEVGFSVKSKWDVEACKSALRSRGASCEDLRPIYFRPFDLRHIYYFPPLLDTPSRPISEMVYRGGNLLLLAPRVKTTDTFCHVLVSRFPAEKKSCTHDRATQMFPVFGLDPRRPETRILNVDARVLGELSAALGNSPADVDALGEMIAAYIYAVLHSPAYRNRYGAALKNSYPRVPIAAEQSLILELGRCGHDLLALHLLESPSLANFITTYTGPKNPEVGRIGWSDGTVWLDAGQTSAREGHRATKPGSIGFRGVPEEAWNFHIGGYQVCHKWLKDRKGRTLSDEDVAHYQKIVVALNETIRVMAEIDEVIETHGGWPGAFQTGSEADAASDGAAKVVPFRPRTVEPVTEDRYVTCVPLVPLRAAAGAFSDQQHIEDDDFEWVAVESRHRLRKGMFVAQVVGKSMEPAIADGAWCLFHSPVAGTRQSKTVLVQLRDATDPETGQRYTVKRYKSEKAKKDDSWRHEKIALEPVNPDFEPIVLTGADDDEFQVVAELVEVL